jgi:hypothetical protein
MMELTYECLGCHAVNRVERVEQRAALECRVCKAPRGVHREAFQDGALCACAVCATEDLYVQKDFPHVLGLSIVVVGFVVSSIFWAYYMPIAATAVLLVSAGIDLVLFYLVRDVTICYRCLSQYRGAGANPAGRFRPFDLAVGERYRQERLRAEELRERQRSTRPTIAEEVDQPPAER